MMVYGLAFFSHMEKNMVVCPFEKDNHIMLGLCSRLSLTVGIVFPSERDCLKMLFQIFRNVYNSQFVLLGNTDVKFLVTIEHNIVYRGHWKNLAYCWLLVLSRQLTQNFWKGTFHRF